MFTLADYLIGIYKVNNCSQTASLRPALFAKKLEERKKSHSIEKSSFGTAFDTNVDMDKTE